MCGIAGIVDLAGERTAPEGVIEAMAQALIHRGPDEEGYFRRNGVELASRRLSIVGLADGQQPVANEDRTVSVVFNGELFDYVEQRAELEARGHRFVTHCDTEDHAAPVGGEPGRDVCSAARAVRHRVVG